MAANIAKFPDDIAARDFLDAGHTLHSIGDVHGAHAGYHLPFGHWRDNLRGRNPDVVLGDDKFLRAANDTFRVLSRDNSVSLSAQQVKDLINAVIAGRKKDFVEKAKRMAE